MTTPNNSIIIQDGRAAFYQWDANVKVTSPNFKVGEEIHFANFKQTTALVVLAYEQDGQIVADVPNILLQSPNPIKVYHYITKADSTLTQEKRSFEVLRRPKPADYVYTETEVLTITTAVEKALQEAKESGEFDGKDGIDGKNGKDADYSLVANALKGTATGNPVVISDFSPFKHPLDITVKGYGSSITVYGKNILPKERNATQTIDGVTFTSSAGKVYVRGTLTNTKCNYKVFKATWNELILPPGRYTFSGCPSGGDPTTYCMGVAIRDQYGALIVDGCDYGNGVTFTASNGIGEIYCTIRLAKGLKDKSIYYCFKPMLSVGTDTEFEEAAKPVEYKAAGYKISGIYSTSNAMTLLTNDLANLIYKDPITVEYNRDINKVITALEQKIATQSAAILNN